MPLNDLLALPADQLLLVYGAMFVGIMLLVESLVQLLISRKFGAEAKINRRLRMLDSGIDPQEVLQRLRHRRGEKDGTAAGGLIARLEGMIAAAGLQITPQRLISIMVAIAFVLTALVKLASPLGILAAATIGVALGAALPLLVMVRLRRRRLQRFAEQLPEAVDLIVRSLRAGHPLNAGLGMVATELPDPIGTEFGIVVDETTYGMDLREAIAQMGKRIDLPDLHYLTIAVRIHYGTGGNLAEVLENLSKLIRSRFQMFRKVRAITAEGRLSAWFLSLFPVVLGGVMIAIKRDYYGPVSESSMFPWIAGITVALLLLNVVVMRWMVNIKV